MRGIDLLDRLSRRTRDLVSITVLYETQPHRPQTFRNGVAETVREINVSHRTDEWVSDTLAEVGHLLGCARLSKFDQHYDFQRLP